MNSARFDLQARVEIVSVLPFIRDLPNLLALNVFFFLNARFFFGLYLRLYDFFLYAIFINDNPLII